MNEGLCGVALTRLKIASGWKKGASPLRFSWRQGRLQQNVTEICDADCDCWSSQLGTEDSSLSKALGLPTVPKLEHAVCQ